MTWNDFWGYLTAALVPVLVSFLVALVRYGMTYLKAKEKQLLSDAGAKDAEKYTNLVDRTLTNLITNAGETVVRELKRAGKWNADAATAIKDAVLKDATGQLEAFRDECQSALLIDLPKYLDSRLEYLLAELKAGGTIRPVEPDPTTETLPAGNSSAIPGGETETAPPGNQP